MSLSGADVLPLVEGGKGISATNGESSGAWARAGGVGTISCVNADTYDENGNIVPQYYEGRSRRERHEELISWSIKGGVDQIWRAYDVSGGQGRLHINVLWEMGGCERILHGVLEKTKGLLNGITCGAGMPYRLAEIATAYNVFYYPIVSSGRAFSALWKRSYRKFPEWLGAVVYEDPWLAGGHNGLSNSERPDDPQSPYPRVLALRKVMREYGLDETPIIMAGGVWHLKDWSDWIDNEELGPICFQFGTRPLLTQESPIPQDWKDQLPLLRKGEVLLHKFSPTGFYSSAVQNPFLNSLIERSKRQFSFRKHADDTHTQEFQPEGKSIKFFFRSEDISKLKAWIAEGFSEIMKTPDDTVILEKPKMASKIRTDQKNCMGCLSQCRFSSWATNEKFSTGRLADPRSFCIQKTLMSIAHDGSVNNELMFAGHSVYNFGLDPFYSNGFVPTVKQLIDRILTGD